jgi:hypothetical protein
MNDGDARDSARTRGGDVSIVAGPESAVRVWLSAGTQLASEEDGPWRAGARIPTEPWREASAGEREALMTAGAAEAGRTLVLFAPPPSLVAKWRALVGVSASAFGETARQVMGRTDYERVTEESISYLRGLTRYGARPLRFFVAETHAGRVSACWDSREFVGLHVDVRERTPLPECAFSPTRFCLNIGRHSRGFVFSDVTLLEMAGRLQHAGHEIPKDMPPQQVADRFMSVFDRYPMARVVLRPGEAYIAPTDNVIHDGFTRDVPVDACDLVVMAIGYFDSRLALASTGLLA